MSVPFSVDGDSFRAEKPVPWADARYTLRGRNRMFDLHPDGKRVAMGSIEQAVGDNQDKVVLVLNFFDELRRIAPAAKP